MKYFLFGLVLLALSGKSQATDFCDGDLFYCSGDDNFCTYKSDRCDGEVDCTKSGVDEIACPLANETYCPDGFERVLGANAGLCYHLKLGGVVNFTDALTYCLSLNAYLVRPNSVAQIEALAAYLNFTSDVIPGYWMGYIRQEARLEDNGTLSAGNAIIRADKFEYYDIYTQCPRVQMNPNLWRSGQPGDHMDHRDEQCVAKKRPGSQAPDFLVGADDYDCRSEPDFQAHYVICEKCHEYETFPANPN